MSCPLLALRSWRPTFGSESPETTTTTSWVLGPHPLAGTVALPSGWRRVMGPAGPHSADLALLAAEPMQATLTTYVELVIASADHVFAGLAVRAVKAGIRVTLVTAFNRPPHWRRYRDADAHLTLADTRTSISVPETAIGPSASSAEPHHVSAPARGARKSHPARKSGTGTTV